MKAPATLLRYGEIAIKGGNRPMFERALRKNVKIALRNYPGVSIESLRGRLLVHHENAPERITQDLRKVCGIKSLSPAHPVQSDLENIERVVLELFSRATLDRSPPPSFRVTTRRADKSFPLRSNQVDRHIGAAIVQRFAGCPVDLEHHDLEVGIDIRPEGCFVFIERIDGPGGLPVGVSGRAVALLSGGIDSPVATYLGMRRGLEMRLLFFHSEAFTGQGPLEKVIRLARVLADYQPHTVLTVMPFETCQTQIKERCPPPYRTILYRRMMHRIAVAVARQESATALVTGDSLAQVASQTLENLELTAAASELPVYRPLWGFDKEETIELARQIDTFDISVLPEPDCCTLFQPRRPKTRGNAEEVLRAEQPLDVAELVADALSRATRMTPCGP